MPSRFQTFVVLAVLTGATCLLGIWISQWFVRSRTNHARTSCVNTLRQIAGAADQWAIEYKKSTNDIPNWSDVDPYMKVRPSCPAGGKITLGSVKEGPKCSIGKGN